MIHALLSAAVWTFAAAAGAAPDRGALEALRAEQAEREARQAELAEAAEDAAEEAAGLQDELVRIGEEISALERAANEAEAQLADLEPREAEAAAALARDRESLIRVLAALQRAEMRKPPALAVSPDDAAGAARAATLLSAIAPELEARAEAVRVRIDALARLREELGAQRTQLAEAQAGLDDQRGELAGRVEQRQALEETLRADAEREGEAARKIAEEAESLGELIAALEQQEAARRLAEQQEAEARARAEREAALRRGQEAPPPAPPPPPAIASRDFASARGALRAPAEGPVVAGFGAQREDGINQGLVIATRGRAQVVSPYDAYVQFADTFGNYGEMLILAVGDGYHIILSGLDRLYAVEGQSVLAGEPLGEMADQTSPAPELYYELRQDGAPIDPAPWIRDGVRAG